MGSEGAEDSAVVGSEEVGDSTLEGSEVCEESAAEGDCSGNPHRGRRELGVVDHTIGLEWGHGRHRTMPCIPCSRTRAVPRGPVGR